MDRQKNAHLSPDSSEKYKVPGTAKPLNPYSARQRCEGRGGEVRPPQRSWGTECFFHHTLHPKSPGVICPLWGVLPFVCLPLEHNSFWRKLRRLQGEAALNSLSQQTDCPRASGGSTARPLYLRLHTHGFTLHRQKASGKTVCTEALVSSLSKQHTAPALH